MSFIFGLKSFNFLQNNVAFLQLLIVIKHLYQDRQQLKHLDIINVAYLDTNVLLQLISSEFNYSNVYQEFRKIN
jgi:hypothetical protein